MADAAVDELEKSQSGASAAGSGAAGGFSSGISYNIRSPLQSMRILADQSLQALKGGLGIDNVGVSSKASEAGKATTSGLESGTEAGTPELLKIYKQLPNDMISIMGDMYSLFTLTGKIIPDAMQQGVKLQHWDLLKFIGELPSKIVAKFDGLGDKLKNLGQSIFTNFRNGSQSAVQGIYDVTLGMCNGVLAIVRQMPTLMWQAGVTAAQYYANGLRAVHIPTPHFGVYTQWASAAGQVFPLPAVSMAWLANGGYVERNTPRLAVIGDNTREGEIVAPESKLQAMADKAAGGNNAAMNTMVSLLETLVALVQDGGETILNVDGTELARASQKGAARLQRRGASVSFS